MKIPASFKIGILEYKVYLTDKIELDNDNTVLVLEKQIKVSTKKLKNSGILFGVCDHSSQTIWLATKDIQGKDVSKERLVTTFYHELAHALVGETAYNEANRDEIFIEALGKNLFAYCTTVSEEEAPVYKEEEEEEEVESKSKCSCKAKASIC